MTGPVSVGYSAQALTWEKNSPAYWSPQAFTAHLGVVSLSQTFMHPELAYELQGLAGVAGERVSGQASMGFGFAFGVTGAMTYRPAPRVELRAACQYEQTIRQLPTATGLAAQPYWWLSPTASVTVKF